MEWIYIGIITVLVIALGFTLKRLAESKTSHKDFADELRVEVGKLTPMLHELKREDGDD